MAGKYSKAADRIEKQQAFTKEQIFLHEKYANPDHKDVVIKEKSNTFKFTIKVMK